MKIFCATAGLALLVCHHTSYARAETACAQTLTDALRSRATLQIDSRPGSLEIVGTDEAALRVTCTAKDDATAGQVQLKFSGNQDHGTLTIHGGGHEGNLQVRVQVPRKTSLKVNMAAGQITVNEVAGDKDIDLHAGQVTISSDRLWDYRSVDASVDIGQLSAPVYGVDKGGFFRSFSKQSAGGEYTLRAHVMTGQIELLSHRATAAPE